MSLHGDAPALAYGLSLYDADTIESWPEVGRYCLKLNREIPKRFGGKFLRPFEIEALEALTRNHWPRNHQIAWFETVIARCHQARDKAKAAGGGGAP